MTQYFKIQVRALVFLDITLWRIKRWYHRKVYRSRKSQFTCFAVRPRCPPVWSRAEPQASGVLPLPFPLLPASLGEERAVGVQRTAGCRPPGSRQRRTG